MTPERFALHYSHDLVIFTFTTIMICQIQRQDYNKKNHIRFSVKLFFEQETFQLSDIAGDEFVHTKAGTTEPI